MVEFNADEMLNNFVYNQKPGWNTSIGTGDEATEQHECRCESAIPFSGIRDETYSENSLELNDLSSKANSSEMEQNIITVVALVHMEPKPHLRRPEVLNEDALPTAIPSIEKSGEAAAGLEQRKTQQKKNDKFPCLAAIADSIERKKPNHKATIREQIIEAERIDYLE